MFQEARLSQSIFDKNIDMQHKRINSTTKKHPDGATLKDTPSLESVKKKAIVIRKKKRAKPGNIDTIDILQRSGKLPNMIHNESA